MAVQRALNTFANLVVLVAVPLLLYYAYHGSAISEGCGRCCGGPGFSGGSSGTSGMLSPPCS